MAERKTHLQKSRCIDIKDLSSAHNVSDTVLSALLNVSSLNSDNHLVKILFYNHAKDGRAKAQKE